MACRSYPADTRLQSFFLEGLEKERDARMKYYLETKRGVGGVPADMQIRGTFANGKGLPQINPKLFALEKFNGEKTRMNQIAIDSRLDETVLMYPVKDRKVTGKLYDGFSKEGKGRVSYLRERIEVIPEKKYEYPVASSWNYGWKINNAFQLQRPKHARSCKIQDNFYSRNGVPSMPEPNDRPPHGMQRQITCANFNM